MPTNAVRVLAHPCFKGHFLKSDPFMSGIPRSRSGTRRILIHRKSRKYLLSSKIPPLDREMGRPIISWSNHQLSTFSGVQGVARTASTVREVRNETK